ncbi:MAG: EAL domain-containing protein [Thermosynechococcaceae cyanobacterium]
MPENEQKSEPYLTRSLSLLIIEDVSEDVDLIRFSLDDANINFTADVASTAIACQQYLAKQAYDGVLSDYRLPNFNGLQAFEILKNSGQDIPFILITGRLGEEAAVECIKTGMTDYVLKDRLFRLPMVLQRALNDFELRHRQKAAIAQIQQQAWRETIINQIVQAMRETLVLGDVLQKTADHLHEALQVSRCLIFQPNSMQKMQAIYVSTDKPVCENLVNISCIFYSYYHQMLVQGKQVATHHIDDGFPPEIKQAVLDYSLHSVMITPLLYQQTYLGGISLYQCDKERVWSENELVLVKAIADQCAIAIHQAELYQSAQTELTERKKIEDRLRHDALHDALTDLPNRTLIINRIHHALQHFRRISHHASPQETNQFAVLFLDLDRFKIVNDSLGHSVGDQMLKMVAQRLTSSLRAEDSLARLGGDEFVILIEEIKEVSDAIEVVHRIHKSLKSPMILDGHEVTVSTSIGIVISAIHYTHPDQLLRDADIAMYRAKHNGRGSYELFDPAMHTQVISQLQIENDLRYAIEHRGLALHYQPIICLKSLEIKGFEALVRWHHPTRGLIYPNEFIPLAEDTGLIIPIDFWVLREACSQLRQWQDRFPSKTSLYMSVNFSAHQFSQPELMTKIDKILTETNLDSQFLRIEITENILIEKTVIANEILNQFRHRNIKICLDDFGIGYSSLNYLHRFPINTLKIDQSFISQLTVNIGDQEIVKAIVNLGLNLGLDIVAEGIKLPEQLELLAEYDCHSGQGYYFSRPLDVAEAEQYLQGNITLAEIGN